jgi:RNA polymerase sigma factor (sigma-70 family)
MIEDVIASGVAETRETRYLRLVSEHERAIHRMASSYERDAARRQDLIQDVWLALWQALPGFRGESSERTFVFRIAHNRGVSHIQHWRRRRTETLDETARIPHTAADPEDALAARQRGEQLRLAVTGLPLGLRQVIVLVLEGLSYREIGDVLGISENNVAVRVARARGALARELGSSGDRS